MSIFSLLVQFAQFVFEAVLKEAQTEEGSAKLTDFLDKLEAAGIDVPFYEPTPTDQQPPTEQQSDPAAERERQRQQRQADRATKRALQQEAEQR